MNLFRDKNEDILQFAASAIHELLKTDNFTMVRVFLLFGFPSFFTLLNSQGIFSDAICAAGAVGFGAVAVVAGAQVLAGRRGRRNGENGGNDGARVKD